MKLRQIIERPLVPFVRWIRRELDRSLQRESENIQLALQRRALESTAAYVELHLLEADTFDSAHSLLSASLKLADLSESKLICEFGVFTGNSINHIAKQTKANVFGFDSFEGLPENWRSGFEKGHFAVPDLPRVPANVTLIKGWFNETLPQFLNSHKEDVSFLHIDCDLYSSTKHIFDLLGHRLKPGCIIVFDEYFNYAGWQHGEYKAFKEFLSTANLHYKYIGYNTKHQQVAVILKEHLR